MRHLILLFFVFTVHLSVSQSLTFAENEYDFGTIQEGDGSAIHEFQFVNSGNSEVRIVGVSASCGCTTPSWTKELLQAGDSGSITASFNPANRPGKFRKSLTVMLSNGEQKMLLISGMVQPKPKTVEDEFPISMGNLRMTLKTINFGNITSEKSEFRSLDFFNAGTLPIRVYPEQIDLPAHLTMKLEQMEIVPGGKGRITITFDPMTYGKLGFVKNELRLMTNDSLMATKKIDITATIQEVFPNLTEEERANAPRLTFASSEFDFGKLKDAASETDLLLYNSGKQNLNIRSIQSNCACVIPTLTNRDIAPGDSTTLSIRFDPENRRGRQYKTVTVFTNDPVSPTQVLSITAEVVR